MELKELKEKVLNKTLENKMYIFKYEDSRFLVQDYINEISKLFKSEINYLNSIDDLYAMANAFFIDSNFDLNVLFVDNLENEVPEMDNVIICCKNISKEVLQEVKNKVIIFPKLENWQIEDYAKVKLDGVEPNAISWLCSIANYDVDRINNEIEKITIFEKDTRNDIFNLINNDNGYSDLNNYNIYNLVNAIVKKDINTIHECLLNIEVLDVEPMGLVALLLRQFKSVIDIQLNNNPTPEKLGMNPKQFNAIKYNCGKYDAYRLIHIYNLLNSIDFLLKSGKIDNDKIIDYVVCNILK